MKSLATFIISYVSTSGRHGGHQFGMDLWNRYSKVVIPNFLKYNPGVESDIIIYDTGSNYPGFNTLIEQTIKKDNRFIHLKVPNIGGCCGPIKYVMHSNPEYLDRYEMFLFITDDTTYVEGDLWAKEAIEDYVSSYDQGRIGLMGRNLRTLPMYPDGVVTHGMCPQVPRMWGCKSPEIIPHIHQDWWMTDSETLRELSKVWYDPVHSKESMDEIAKYENTNFQELAMGPKQKIFHIGREIDTSIRLTRLLNRHLMGYSRLKGEKIFSRPIF